MKIITKYILREHVGPFTFSLTALTSLMLLNFISRQLGDLVGKGLPKSAIGEFFLLSVPFTVALTLPMSVLVAVLYAFSRLAAENEVTALKASGVSPWRLVGPAIVWGLFMSLFLLAFNDQVLPRANHQLKTLQDDIAQAKPTFLLKPQVINAITEGKFYLKAGTIDQSNGKMTEVVIYDLGDPTRRRTIYADSGRIQFDSNRKDLNLELYHGQMQEVATEKPSELNRLFYDHDRIRIREVAKDLVQTEPDSANRGDRELGICAMQKRLRGAQASYDIAIREHADAVADAKNPRLERVPERPKMTLADLPEPRGIGWAYCALMGRLVTVQAAQAADLSSLPPADSVRESMTARTTTPQDVVRKQETTTKPDTTKKQVTTAKQDTAKQVTTTQQDTTKKVAATKQDTTKKADTAKQSATKRDSAVAQLPGGTSANPRVLINGVLIDPRTGLAAPPVPVTLPGAPGQPPQQGVVLGTSNPGTPLTQEQIAAMAARTLIDSQSLATKNAIEGMSEKSRLESLRATNTVRAAEAKMRVDLAKLARNRYAIEIHKKFSLAAACLIFVVLGAPLALRFPRGGVGLVLSVSLVVFALYYVGLIGGESLSNKGYVDPFWAMWGTNVILTVIGVVLLFRMGRGDTSGRGGGWGDRMDRLRDALRARRRATPTGGTA